MTARETADHQERLPQGELVAVGDLPQSVTAVETAGHQEGLPQGELVAAGSFSTATTICDSWRNS